VSTGTQLGLAFEAALAYAVNTHGTQKRKGTEIPYAAHLLAVSALVLEAGGTEAQAIAALLHDAPEDCGGQPTLDVIRLRFGDEVGDIVEACSDSLTEDATEKAPWKERKVTYLAHLADVPAGILLVSLADKRHNAGAILRDLNDVGMSMFDRFNAGPDASAWYYRELVETFERRRAELTDGGRLLLGELGAIVDAISERVGSAAI
jgi:(p)ppGpp synthase/HD superfamily hydrolase